jgi:hypothetical protein
MRKTFAHLGVEQPHAEDVRLLALDVYRAHIDDALQAEHCTDRRCRYAMLARAGLGDDPGLAHALRQQALAQGIVDLVGAGMRQVLALEVDSRPAAVLGQACRVCQRGWAAGVAAVQPVELLPEARVGLGFLIGGH